MASVTWSSSAGSQSKSGKPWPRLTAPVSCASADITVKIVVPTFGRRLVTVGVRAGVEAVQASWSRMSELVVGAMAAHGARDQRGDRRGDSSSAKAWTNCRR